ncbi:hypothetical protein AAC387_Pa06g0675 [Persea americana]
MQKGIFFSCSAGNEGPYSSSVSNGAPWYLTVGASTIDRSIRATVKLGNGESFHGESAFQPKDLQSNNPLPITYPGANGNDKTAKCTSGSLAGFDVQVKMVLCERGRNERIAKGLVVMNAGGAAMILMNTADEGFSINAEAHVLPALHVSFLDGSEIKAYINSTRPPTATIIFKGTVLGTSPSPMVSSISSRGPNSPSLGILKLDIIGPEIAPDWSPAAIRSAIMTTADVVDHKGRQIIDERLAPADLFAIGAGHVNPSRANNPGLVYDIKPDDYVSYLCGLGYSDNNVELIAGSNVSCASITSIREGELNFPSFSVILGPSQTFNRTVTTVGEAKITFSLEIIKPRGGCECGT